MAAAALTAPVGITPRRSDAILAAALGLLAQAEVWLTDAAEGQRPVTSLTAGVMCAPRSRSRPSAPPA